MQYSPCSTAKVLMRPLSDCIFSDTSVTSLFQYMLLAGRTVARMGTMPALRAMRTIARILSIVNSSEYDPAFSAISLIPAKIRTPLGLRFTTSGTKRSSICADVCPATPRPTILLVAKNPGSFSGQNSVMELPIKTYFGAAVTAVLSAA